VKITPGVKAMAHVLFRSLTVAGFIAFGVGLAPAIGAPTTGAGQLTLGQSLIEPVQSYHRSCGWMNNGWFYSLNGSFVSCRPRRPEGRDWGWRVEGDRSGWYHSRRKAWMPNPNFAR
jgi:hypothetical protein